MHPEVNEATRLLSPITPDDTEPRKQTSQGGRYASILPPAKGSLPPSYEEDEDEGGWQPSRGFWWIELALWANVFLSGFDGTITASTYALISSDFGAANDASWLTTSYLVTSTAFQPLYGRFSDVLGRRVCFMVSTVAFMVGCLGCSLARSMVQLDVARAVAGFGGGGLITMATVINSDMIPFRKRGMYQAMQNTMMGLGAALGASLGGVIAQSIGWRWCFLMQVPVSLLALGVGYSSVADNKLVNTSNIATAASDAGTTTTNHNDNEHKSSSTSSWMPELRYALRCLDLSGATVLVLGLVAQLLGLGLGGNDYPWASPQVTVPLVASVLLLAGFVVIEARTKAIPLIPLRMLRSWQPVAVQLTGLFSGMASFAYMFLMPLYLQAVRGDSPSQAGIRLMIPSLATPIGGLLAGSMMQRGLPLSGNVRMGAILTLLGNALTVTLGTSSGSRWKEFLYLVPANFGLGLSNPSCLFSFLSFFEHREQAVATSTVYLIRAMGNIYGITIASAITQNVLKARLSDILGGGDNSELVDHLRQSVFAIDELPTELQGPVRGVYWEALRLAFIASSGFALLSLAFSLALRTGKMGRKSSNGS